MKTNNKETILLFFEKPVFFLTFKWCTIVYVFRKNMTKPNTYIYLFVWISAKLDCHDELFLLTLLALITAVDCQLNDQIDIHFCIFYTFWWKIFYVLKYICALQTPNFVISYTHWPGRSKEFIISTLFGNLVRPIILNPTFTRTIPENSNTYVCHYLPIYILLNKNECGPLWGQLDIISLKRRAYWALYIV